MLEISDLTYRVGARPLFENANAFIAEGWKVGLVGRNVPDDTTVVFHPIPYCLDCAHCVGRACGGDENHRHVGKITHCSFPRQYGRRRTLPYGRQLSILDWECASAQSQALLLADCKESEMLL